MPYGLKRGIKAPGEFGISDVFGLALAGATGIVAAVVTDYQQSGEASALYTINQWVVSAAKLFGFGDIPLWMVIAGLIGLGAGSVFYFQPITRQGAFAQGFGLLAVLMTAVPSDLAGGLELVADGQLPGLEPVEFQREARRGAGIQPAAFTINEGAARGARLYQAQFVREESGTNYVVYLEIKFPEGLPEDAKTMIRKGTLRGRLHNAETGETYNLFRAAGGIVEERADAIVIRAGVPARADAATLWVRIECEGYSIEEQSSEARLGGPLTWVIDMQPSSSPLFLQRLRKSYWF